MKEFINVLRRFLPPYKHYLMLTVAFNILSAILNIFSFAAIIPILQILFKTSDTTRVYHFMPWSWDHLKDVVTNNAYYYVHELIGSMGPTTTLLIIGLF